MGNLHPQKYHWNGFLFGNLMEDSAKKGVFPNVKTKGEMENYINQYIKNAQSKYNDGNNENKNISRDMFHRWSKDGNAGPRDKYTISLIDEMFPNTYFLRKPCSKAMKKTLFEIYNLAWLYHYECALLTEGEEALKELIDTVKKEKLREEEHKKSDASDALENLHGKQYDNVIKPYSEEIYLLQLLDVFWEGYHQILIDAGLEGKLHGIFWDGQFYRCELVDETLVILDEQEFQETYKDVLQKRQFYLEGFADNLRTLFLGKDL